MDNRPSIYVVEVQADQQLGVLRRAKRARLFQAFYRLVRHIKDGECTSENGIPLRNLRSHLNPEALHASQLLPLMGVQLYIKVRSTLAERTINRA